MRSREKENYAATGWVANANASNGRRRDKDLSCSLAEAHLCLSIAFFQVAAKMTRRKKEKLHLVQVATVHLDHVLRPSIRVAKLF